MKRILLLLLAAPALSFAGSPIDGTWVADLGSAKLPEKPDVMAFDKGWYDCKSCIPAIHVKADGTDQPVTGHAYYDTIAVQVPDAKTVVVTAKKAGKLMYVDTNMLAADGASMTDSFEDHTESAPITGKAMAVRVAAGPAGAHALSGSWRTTQITNMTQNALTDTVHVTDKGMSLRDGNGTGYDAQFDGKDYPMVGDVGHTLVSVKHIDDRTIEETDKRDGKVVAVIRVSVAPDGKTAQFVMHDQRNGTTTTFTLRKQS